MPRRRVVTIAVGLVAVVSALVLWDLAIETDAERLQVLADECSGTVSQSRLEQARARWVDLEIQPLEVNVFGQPQVFTAGDDDALTAHAARGLQGLMGTTVRVLSTHIESEGNTGTVELRLLTDRGLVRANWRVCKHDGRWLVERLHVQRG